MLSDLHRQVVPRVIAAIIGDKRSQGAAQDHRGYLCERN
jgi:hypothetical protein